MTITRRSFTTAVGAGLSVFLLGAAGRRSHFKVSWLGGPSFVLEFGSLRLIGDPVLGTYFTMGDPNEPRDYQTIRHHTRRDELPENDCPAVDAILLSHAHEDHFDAAAAMCFAPNTPLVLPLADEPKLSAMGFDTLIPLAWEQRRRFAASDYLIDVTAVRADHSRVETTARVLGTGNGYWLDLTYGSWKRSIYWTGDTMPTPAVIDAVKAHGAPFLLIAHAGKVGDSGPFGRISMGGQDLAELVRTLQPTHVLPIHHSTFDFYREAASDIGASLRRSGAVVDVARHPFATTYD